MSAEDFSINATLRETAGKGASRRLRREANLVPAIVYGGRKKPQNIAIKFNEFMKHLEHEAFYSHIISLDIEGSKEDVILKDLQRHPSKAAIYHADFLRVSKTKKLTTRAPLHFINEATSKGVKLQGGVITHNLTELEISCLPQDLPEYIEVDLQEIEVGQIVHITDIKLPKGVESVALSHGDEQDLAVATISLPRGSASEDEDDAAEDGDESEGKE